MRNDKKLSWVPGAANGKWTPEDRAQFEQDSQEGLNTAKLLEDQQRLWKLLDSWEAPPVSSDFDRKLYRRIEAAQAAPWYSRAIESLRLRPLQPAVPLALATVLVFTGLVVDRSRTAHTSSNTTGVPIVSVNDADQIENSLNDLQLLQVYAEPSTPSSHSM